MQHTYQVMVYLKQYMHEFVKKYTSKYLTNTASRACQLMTLTLALTSENT